jgi:hypothetical protein
MTVPALTPERAREIAFEGYIYLYPLITMEITRRQLSSGPEGAQIGRGPANLFHHIRAFPPADFKAVVRPNFDTLYSSAWVDLSDGPVIVSAPDSGGRYYLLPCLDMWSDVFAVPGLRTSGADPIDFALVPPDWEGTLPVGVERIDAPTPTVWIIGRTQTNGPADYAAVNAFQDGLGLTPLASWGGGTLPEPVVLDNPEWDTKTPPLDLVNGMPVGDYFALGAELMAQHPSHLTDWSIIARLRDIGFTPGQAFDLEAQSPTVRAAFDGIVTAALAAIRAEVRRVAPLINGWLTTTDSIGVYGNFYLKRAAVAMVGLGANPAEDAVYPLLEQDADGNPIDGGNAYTIHFDADALPPVDAFWSITMYDEAGFQVPNELDRFAIGDRDDLVYNADGSLDIHLQPDNPGPERVANWLPSVAGRAGVTMRLYLPRAEALTGGWSAPPVVRAS